MLLYHLPNSLMSRLVEIGYRLCPEPLQVSIYHVRRGVKPASLATPEAEHQLSLHDMHKVSSTMQQLLRRSGTLSTIRVRFRRKLPSLVALVDFPAVVKYDPIYVTGTS